MDAMPLESSSLADRCEADGSARASSGWSHADLLARPAASGARRPRTGNMAGEQIEDQGGPAQRRAATSPGGKA